MAILESVQDHKLRQLYILQCLSIHPFPLLSHPSEHSLPVPRASSRSFCAANTHNPIVDLLTITLRTARDREFTATGRSLRTCECKVEGASEHIQDMAWQRKPCQALIPPPPAVADKDRIQRKRHFECRTPLQTRKAMRTSRPQVSSFQSMSLEAACD